MSWNSPAFVIWRRNFLRTFSSRSFSPSVTSIEPPQRTRTRAAAQVLGVSLWIAVHGLPPCDRLPKLRLVAGRRQGDRKSTRLNSSHSQISYAVFCLKKKKTL